MKFFLVGFLVLLTVTACLLLGRQFEKGGQPEEVKEVFVYQLVKIHVQELNKAIGYLVIEENGNVKFIGDTSNLERTKQ